MKFNFVYGNDEIVLNVVCDEFGLLVHLDIFLFVYSKQFTIDTIKTVFGRIARFSLLLVRILSEILKLMCVVLMYQMYKYEMMISDYRWCTRAVCATKI